VKGESAIGRGLLALFVLSGVAGLIYQSVWSHYLGLTLGHAAYAQALVLAIYMGGMALGAWLASRFGVRWRRLILAYAVVEAVIGVIGLLFHPAFVAYTAFSEDVVLPRIGSDLLAHAWQWSSAALSIAPQSILLGMTFPLMSGGYLRIAPRQDGEVLGGLYFTNSIGAAFGALLCTFVLLPWIGMPGAVRVAGCINLVVAVLAAGLAVAIARLETAAGPVPAATPGPTDEAATSDGARAQKWLLAAAFVTGATSFVYEVGWVRLLNQALGTTVHSFELMLSAFILGLAIGGLWVRFRSSRIADPVAATGHAQVWMGIAALISVPMFTQSFHWVGWMMGALARNASGYVLFNLGSAAIAMLVMFPAAFFAGMTLPLMTVALLRRGRGEASIGRIYAANTLGAIVGVFVTMHVLIPTIGVGLSVTLAAFGDLALGLLLLRYLVAQPRWGGYAVSAACGVAALIVSLHFGRPDPAAQAAGVFRTGATSIPDGKVVYQRDGKTATVSVFTEGEGFAVIATNGKPDAGLQVLPRHKASPDEVTMRMAAALPLGLHPHPRDVAIVGWGSGMTTATFLSSKVPESVATIEIEHAMYDGARLFGPKVALGYTDPRSHPHFDDARTYFSTGNRQFDVVVSEPSNPWVTGVASLFTKEFYGLVRRHLRPDGVMVQWIQSYELDDRLLGTMVAALVEVFPHVQVYLTNSSDLIFVASTRPLPEIDMSAFASEPLHSELADVGLARPADYAVRRIGSERLLRAFANYSGVGPHSDYHPVVSLDGPRARFMGESSNVLQALVTNGMPVLDVLEHRTPLPADAVTDEPQSTFALGHALAREVATALRSGDTAALQALAPDSAATARDLLAIHGAVGADTMPRWYSDVSMLAGKSIGALPADDLRGAWIDPAWVQGDSVLPPAALAVLSAFDAAARRDMPQLRPRALAALARLREEPHAPDVLREQMLVLAMLGAVGEGRNDQVGALERTWGAAIAPSGTYAPVRVYLQAWADLR
jgi:spermidine synthase/MFS family permease